MVERRRVRTRRWVLLDENMWNGRMGWKLALAFREAH